MREQANSKKTFRDTHNFSIFGLFSKKKSSYRFLEHADNQFLQGTSLRRWIMECSRIPER